MFTICSIENLSGAELYLHGHTFSIGEVYSISDEVRVSWAESDSVISAITSGDVIVHGVSGAITEGISKQIDWLKNYMPHLLEVEKMPPFAEPLHRTKKDATSDIITCPKNTVTTVLYDVDEEMYVSGGDMIIRNAQFGDYVSADVHDTDAVIPEAYRPFLCENWPIVATYILKQYIRFEGRDYTVHTIDTKPLNAKITGGLKLRVSYHAVDSGVDREVGVNYDLTKAL